MSRSPLSRRALLRGAGVLIGLPYLEAMTPGKAAQAALRAAQDRAPGQTGFPNRMVVCYLPNGVHTPYWVPEAEGAGFALSPSLEPLQALKDQVLVLSNLSLDKAKPNGDGVGDHARAMASFLTGVQARKTEGSNIRIGISADQYAAQHLGHRTRFPSLELGLDYGKLEGACDPGYACIYSNNLSWRSETTPAIKEVNPRSVFDRLFGGRAATDADAEKRDQTETYNRSILDFVGESLTGLNRQLGTADRRRMDEYLTSIREVERRLDQPPLDVPTTAAGGLPRPARVPETFREHFRIMADLLVLALQMDVTRIGTFALGVEQSRRVYREIGIADEHHGLTHHANDPAKIEKVGQIDRYMVEQFAYLLERMQAVREGDGTLLDHSMVLLGNGNGDGALHNHDDLAILLAGRGNGTIDPGRHVRYERRTPFMNLVLELLDRMQVPAERFGDSTGRLGRLTV